MPGENSISQSQRKNLPHIVTNLDQLNPVSMMGGLFKFISKPQAYNIPTSNKYHTIQPITTVSTNAFTGSNYFFDFNIPMDIDMINEQFLELALLNTSSTTDWAAKASLPFWIQRIEIRHNGEIKQTLRDIHLYMDNTIYRNDFEREKLVPLVGINKDTYKADSATLTVLQGGGTNVFRLKINSILARCQLFIKALKGQIVVRVYPQAISVFSNSTANSSIQLQTATLLIEENELTPDACEKLKSIHRSNVDYRFLDVIDEQAVLTLTSGTTTKYVTNNFYDQVYSHLVVLTRANNASNEDLEIFVKHNNVYVEDVSSTNLSNGIQWTDDQLRKVVYTSNFPNSMSLQTDMNVYVPLAPSSDCEASYKKGVNAGFDILPRNCKICISAASSATYQVDILCYAYLHVRVQDGAFAIL